MSKYCLINVYFFSSQVWAAFSLKTVDNIVAFSSPVQQQMDLSIKSMYSSVLIFKNEGSSTDTLLPNLSGGDASLFYLKYQ